MTTAQSQGLALALELIRHFESCHLKSYVLKGESWATVGWGHAIPLVQHPRTISQQVADHWLAGDVQSRQDMLEEHVHPARLIELTAGQYAATLDFAFNAVPSEFAGSHYLIYINAGNFKAAATELPKWVHGGVGGKQVLPGLVARRRCDRVLFNGGSIESIRAAYYFQC